MDFKGELLDSLIHFSFFPPRCIDDSNSPSFHSFTDYVPCSTPLNWTIKLDNRKKPTSTHPQQASNLTTPVNAALESGAWTQSIIYYEVSKERGRHRVRQTFGQLVVEHAYPAQKLQLPSVSAYIVVLDHLADESSSKPVCQNKLARSIALLSNFRRISSLVSKRFGRRRRRRTRMGDVWAKAETLGMRSRKPTI
jgi:transcription initiation factor TFIID subunit 1